MLEATFADDVQFRVVAHGALDQIREGSPFQLRQMLAGEVRDEVRGGVDGTSVDRLHIATVPGPCDSLPVTGCAALPS